MGGPPQGFTPGAPMHFGQGGPPPPFFNGGGGGPPPMPAGSFSSVYSRYFLSSTLVYQL